MPRKFHCDRMNGVQRHKGQTDRLFCIVHIIITFISIVVFFKYFKYYHALTNTIYIYVYIYYMCRARVVQQIVTDGENNACTHWLDEARWCGRIVTQTPAQRLTTSTANTISHRRGMFPRYA